MASPRTDRKPGQIYFPASGFVRKINLSRFSRFFIRFRFLRVIKGMEKDTLYFDGDCPICSAEISRLARYSKGQITLKDIHSLDGDEANLDKHRLLSRLHLKTADGQWVTGLKANIRAWHHTPFRYLWCMLDWPLVSLVSHRCYEAWIRHRNRARL
ncbi:MAG: DUF393 domain-containing protein [Pseudomonadota bacterium]